MNWSAISFDWNQIRAFLATVEEGSLSAASRAVGQTQPTLSRQVSMLEQDLGVTLFERGPRTMSLTPAGLDLLDHVRAMADAAMRISLSSSGQSQSIEGHVSITATDTVTTYVLPSVLAKLRDHAPNITVDLIASNDSLDLIKREADIAIRHGRPEQPDLIAKCIHTSTGYLYASKSYLSKFGNPVCLNDLLEATFVGFSPIERYIPELNRYLGIEINADQISYSAADSLTVIELVRQGLGIAPLLQPTAELVPDLVPILKDQFSVPIPYWLVTHRELRTSRRIRLVYDLLEKSLSGALGPNSNTGD